MRPSRSAGKPKKGGVFAKLKNVFKGGKSSSSSVRSDGSNLGLTLTKTKTRGSSYRRSIFGPTASDKEEMERERKEQELEERRAKCIAIKMAKHDPIEVQKLLVDCEFCNPPPDYGREIPIVTPQFTSRDVHLPGPDNPITDPDDELTWNVGFNEWCKVRNWWLTPTSDAVERHHLDPSFSSDRFFAIYDKMIYHTRPLKQPLNLEDIVKIVKAGWVGEGTWPEEDLWVSSGDEEAANNDTLKVPEATSEPVSRTSTLPSLVMTQAESPVPLRASKSAGSSIIDMEKNDRVSGLDTSSQTGNASLTPIVSGPGHVQFQEKPHPRRPGHRESTPDRPMPLERMQSGMNLRPSVSRQSSVVFVTDSD